MPLSAGAHRAIRIALGLVIAAGAGLAFHRLRRSEEQTELTRYVDVELPSLLAEEHEITDALDHMLADKQLTAAPARKRLADELQPRLVRLRRRAEALQPKTPTVRELAANYLHVIDAWTEATRTAIRAIDDPTLSTEAGLLTVRERLADAAGAERAWQDSLVRTCEHHRLAPPRTR
jgi:hypothetical protein